MSIPLANVVKDNPTQFNIQLYSSSNRTYPQQVVVPIQDGDLVPIDATATLVADSFLAGKMFLTDDNKVSGANDANLGLTRDWSVAGQVTLTKAPNGQNVPIGTWDYAIGAEDTNGFFHILVYGKIVVTPAFLN